MPVDPALAGVGPMPVSFVFSNYRDTSKIQEDDADPFENAFDEGSDDEQEDEKKTDFVVPDCE